LFWAGVGGVIPCEEPCNGGGWTDLACAMRVRSSSGKLSAKAGSPGRAIMRTRYCHECVCCAKGSDRDKEGVGQAL